MSGIRYLVASTNGGTTWTVLRRNSRGDTKELITYADEAAAQHVAEILSANAHREV